MLDKDQMQAAVRRLSDERLADAQRQFAKAFRALNDARLLADANDLPVIDAMAPCEEDLFGVLKLMGDETWSRENDGDIPAR